MIRATTPLQEFVFTDNPDTFARVLITYSQDDNIVLEKGKEDLAFTPEYDEAGEVVDYIGAFRMTQEEANLFEPGAAQVQVRVLMTSGEALAGDRATMKVEEVLNDEVLS